MRSGTLDLLFNSSLALSMAWKLESVLTCMIARVHRLYCRSYEREKKFWFLPILCFLCMSLIRVFLKFKPIVIQQKYYIDHQLQHSFVDLCLCNLKHKCSGWKDPLHGFCNKTIKLLMCKRWYLVLNTAFTFTPQ